MSIPLHALPVHSPANLRARVFVPVFLLACAAALAYVFARDPVYVSTARLQVEAPRSDNQGKDGDRLSSVPHLLNATQALTGSAVMDQVRPVLPPGQAGTDALRGMLSAAPVPGSSVIELRAEGGNGAVLPQILSAWIDAYRRIQSESVDRSSTQALEEARDAFARAKQDAAARRQELEQFRRKHDIVSLEREENQTTARLKALNAAMNEARAREVNAEARLNGMRENLAAGKAPQGAERSIVVELEKRASDLRERMKELEQDYTAHFLAADTKYKTMRANLARLEQQIEQEKQAGTRNALQKEEQEVASAREAVTRLREELSARKREAQDFMARFSENAALEKELARFEETQGAAGERLARLEGEKRAPRPELTVLNLPTVPDRPDRPDYWRDAAIAVAGAGVLGFLAVWFVEFFQRSGVPRPDAGVQPVIHISYPPGVAFDAGVPAIGAPAPPAIGGTAARLPETIAPGPRELSGREVQALWSAATPDARLTIAGLFGGMSLEEIAAMRYSHMDPDAGALRIPARPGRPFSLRDPLRRLLIERQAARGGEAPLVDERGQLLTEADLEGLVACAAHDAGLSNAGEVTSAAVRHTYLAFLVRQGARLAEIGELIGGMPPAAYREYGPLSPPGPGVPVADIDPVYPVLRDIQR